MKDINLIPHSFSQDNQKNGHLYLLIFIVVILITTIVYAVIVNHRISAFRTENTVLQEKLIKLDSSDNSSNSAIGSNKKREVLINTIAADNPAISIILDKILNVKPEGLTLVRITQLESRTLVISGNASTNSKVTEYAAKLKEYSGLKNLTVKLIHEITPNNYQFELQGSI